MKDVFLSLMYVALSSMAIFSTIITIKEIYDWYKSVKDGEDDD